MPITRSLTISGRVAQLFSTQSWLISSTLAVRRGSRSEPTTVGRLVSITSRVTGASASGRYCPIQSSSTRPRAILIRVRSPSPSITVISHSGTPTLSQSRLAVAAACRADRGCWRSSRADSLISVIRRTLSSSSRYRRALAKAWPATWARPTMTSGRANGRFSRLQISTKPISSPPARRGTVMIDW